MLSGRVMFAVDSSGSSRDTHCAEYLVGRCRLPLPRVTLGPHLVGIARAAADVSHGLVADSGHICAVSNLGTIVDGSAVPLPPQAAVAIDGSPQRFAAALTGGDDYEIVFTASGAAAVLGRHGESLRFESKGWTHFGREGH